MPLVFDEYKHVYTFDGNRIPSVTQVLKSAGFVDDSWFNEGARERGTYVHKAVELWNENRLDLSTVDPDILGYLEGWEKFVTEHNMQPIKAESRVYNPTYRYAGTLDYIGKSEKGKRWLLDIKTGTPCKWHSLQLSAYKACLKDIDVVRTIYLSADGCYNAPRVDLKNEWQVFCSALACHNYKQTGK